MKSNFNKEWSKIEVKTSMRSREGKNKWVSSILEFSQLCSIVKAKNIVILYNVVLNVYRGNI